MQSNPFQTSMVKMKAPDGCGDTIAVGGFTVELDGDDCTTVPQSIAKELESHGFKPFVAPKPVAKEPVKK